MIKRALDVFIAAGGLVVLSPLLLSIAVAVRIAMGRPVLFRQQRPGLNGKPFRLLKFRTMTCGGQAGPTTASDRERITTLGRLLRETSLDELPEFVNVLKGDMSLVGPRPLLMEYLPRYTQEQMRRHDVRPGITGWAQVNGRNAVSWEEKFKLDVWYVDKQSLWLDLKILALTTWKILTREGISHPGQATMHEFSGSDS